VRKIVLVALLLGVVAITRCRCRDTPVLKVRVATFNIENFPKDAKQIDGAFVEIAKLRAPIVGLQEITDPIVFDKLARARLGEHWKSIFIETGSVLEHRLGVLYDSRAFAHKKTRVHDGTRLGGSHKPVLDVELADGKGRRVRVLVLHLKAGGENQPIRKRQHAALRSIVADVKKSGALVVLLGDFNSTGDADREDLARIPLQWLTESLACTAFRTYYNEGCPRSRLDHVLATEAATSVMATGGCATHGCDWQNSCPVYAHEVSDHCPVVVEISR
jgi:endonuclease/exonuclease/phosphatase family metal-dependent hydrolase